MNMHIAPPFPCILLISYHDMYFWYLPLMSATPRQQISFATDLRIRILHQSNKQLPCNTVHSELSIYHHSERGEQEGLECMQTDSLRCHLAS